MNRVTVVETNLPVGIDNVALCLATADDAGELLVLQRCCWVEEAIMNETLEIPALHESIDIVRQSLSTWNTWIVRQNHRLVGSVRARIEAGTWEIGRLMVAPDLAGRGLGRWLLRFAEEQAPAHVGSFTLFTGALSIRNIEIYERAGFRRSAVLTPPGTVRLDKQRARL
jgi:GNAT superfamily N-acetyltransferase